MKIKVSLFRQVLNDLYMLISHNEIVLMVFSNGNGLEIADLLRIKGS